MSTITPSQAIAYGCVLRLRAAFSATTIRPTTLRVCLYFHDNSLSQSSLQDNMTTAYEPAPSGVAARKSSLGIIDRAFPRQFASIEGRGIWRFVLRISGAASFIGSCPINYVVSIDGFHQPPTIIMYAVSCSQLLF